MIAQLQTRAKLHKIYNQNVAHVLRRVFSSVLNEVRVQALFEIGVIASDKPLNRLLNVL